MLMEKIYCSMEKNVSMEVCIVLAFSRFNFLFGIRTPLPCLDLFSQIRSKEAFGTL